MQRYYHYWKYQPPQHPLIFPCYPQKSTAFYFYKYKPRFSDAGNFIPQPIIDKDNHEIDFESKSIENIDSEQEIQVLFPYEYSDNNLWFANTD